MSAPWVAHREIFVRIAPFLKKLKAYQSKQ